ncbi:S24/S26 family peptidase [Antarcticibacterium sp. 1MA-6-2]|uniref:S24 family peptidase n=1 Tax=Antarcticibacterium sp. 1MA-6-2 TaxID=2908210 RepID=UPI001F4789A2|nr:S24/S26 family peptidase [Antarcticibacterium sp. 1MA-6-2]UJH92063.1 S24/S26 family peptidase [Antarcticibacterium sp. 1MA-6-2]
MTPKNGFLPLIDAKAHAGLIRNIHKEDLMDDFEYYKIPGYNPTKDSVLIEIEGDSMQPTILSGDVLICQTQHNLSYVVDGSLVVIVTEEDLFTKRIFKHENSDYFWLESDNPGETNKKKIKRSDIKQLLMIIGKVSNILIPHKELAYKGKIKVFQENLDSINQEIFKIKNKLDDLLKKQK